MRTKTKYITNSAMIAALYIVLTLIANAFGLASSAIQFRISEALTILPLFTSAAIPGLTIGCLLANIITGCTFLDIVVGTLATFLGAVGVFLVRNSKYKILSPFFPILFNSFLVAFVLCKVTEASGAAAFYTFFAQVFLGEFVCCGILGLILYFAIKKFRNNN